jgi:hypothetical protein
MEKKLRVWHLIIPGNEGRWVLFSARRVTHGVSLEKTGHAVDTTACFYALADVDDLAANSGGLVLLAHG